MINSGSLTVKNHPWMDSSFFLWEGKIYDFEKFTVQEWEAFHYGEGGKSFIICLEKFTLKKYEVFHLKGGKT